MKELITTVKLGDKKIGTGQPIFIMADIGLTNGGSIDRTLQLIDLISGIDGVDAVKMQMIDPDNLLGDKSVEYTYPTLHDGNVTENMYKMFLDLNYTEAEWKMIAEYTYKSGLEFICTSHTMNAVSILENIGVNIHKICSWSANHKRLVQEIGKTKKTLMIDTGTLSAYSLMRLFDWYKSSGGTNTITLHDFHTTDRSDMNFLSIPYIKRTFGGAVGYTPQGRDFDMDFMSIGLGVDVLEKRITIDRSIAKNGHIKSLEPNEFSDWVKRVRYLEESLGHYSVIPTKSDLKQSERYFKSLYAKVEIKSGEVIMDSMLEAKRPGIGISAHRVDEVCGRRAARDISCNSMIMKDDLW